MPIEIPLAQQTELPPSGVGAAKPGFGLADRSGQVALGQAIAGIANKVWSEIITSKVANEKAIFLGAEKTARANLNNFITENPFASEADIRKAQGKMIQEIETAGQHLSMQESKEYAKNWMALNKDALLIKSGNEITELIKQREQKNFNLQMEALEGSTDPSSLQEGLTLIDNQTGTLIDPETSELFKEVFTQTKIAQLEKIAKEVRMTAALEVATSFRDPVTKEIDLKAGQESINDDPLLSADEKLDVLGDLNMFHAREEQAVEQQRDKDRKTINDQLYIELDFDKAADTISNSNLDETEKGIRLEKTRNLQLLWAKGGKDAKQEKTKSDLLIKISQNPRKFDDDFMADEALRGNIHPSSLPALKLWRDKVVSGRAGTVAGKKGMKLLEIYNKQGVFGKGAEGANLYIETVDNFTEFLLEEDRTATEVTDYIESMTPELTNWEKFWRAVVPGPTIKGGRTSRIRELVSEETERLEETEGNAEKEKRRQRFLELKAKR